MKNVNSFLSTGALKDLFKPAEGSWECPGCYSRSSGDVIKCPACATLKPGAKPEDVSKEPASSGFTFGAASAPATGGFTFGKPAADSTQTPAAPPKFSFGQAAAPASEGASPFKAPVTFTSTPAAVTPAKPTTQKGGFVFGGVAPTSTTPSAAATASPSLFGGNKSGTSPSKPGVFSFSTDKAKEESKPKDSAGSGGLLAKLLTSNEPATLDPTPKPVGMVFF